MYNTSHKYEGDFMSKLINLNDIKKSKQDNPVMVLLCGVPGSGKTTTSKYLSQSLGFFVASSDYIRNYYRKKYNNNQNKLNKLSKRVANVCKTRIALLLLNKSSFVIDMDFRDKDRIKRYEKVGNLLGYSVMKIRLDSKSHEENISRVSKRTTNLDIIDTNIIGDNCEYSNKLSELSYYELISDRPTYIDDKWFDFIIDNNGDIDNLNKELKTISQRIKEISLTKHVRK